MDALESGDREGCLRIPSGLGFDRSAVLLDIIIRDIVFVHDEVIVRIDARSGNVGVGYCDSLRDSVGKCWSTEDQRQCRDGERKGREVHCEDM